MTTPLKLQLGSTVLYKDDYWLAVEYDGKSKITIMQPNKGQHKRTVKVSSITAVVNVPPAQLVEAVCSFRPDVVGKYLVTRKNIVISKQSLRVINSEQIRNEVLANVAK